MWPPDLMFTEGFGFISSLADNLQSLTFQYFIIVFIIFTLVGSEPTEDQFALHMIIL